MIASVHVPKTAGRSFLAFLRDEFGADRICEDWRAGPRIEGGVGPVAAFVQDLRGHHNRIRNYLRRHSFDCVHGHFLASKYAFLGTPMVAWVRDPVERVASHHAYQRRHPDPHNSLSAAILNEMSLIEFAALPRMRNLQSRYLDVPLERFAFIGRTEHFASDLRRAGAVLGLRVQKPPRTNINPDKKGERYDISTADRARILALNQEDAKLYDRVSEVFHS